MDVKYNRINYDYCNITISSLFSLNFLRGIRWDPLLQKEQLQMRTFIESSISVKKYQWTVTYRADT